MQNVRLALLSVVSLAFSVACGGASTGDHGTLSRLSTVQSETLTLCEHEVPADVCTLCNPELEAQYREIGDWCGPHGVPESQCHRCHPDLQFTALPPLSADADYAELSDDEALAGLEAHAVAGKVTVFDFYAPWCAPCLNLEVELHDMANANPQVAVRKITVNEWSGPVVNRYLVDASGLPHVIVYGPDGTFVAALSGRETNGLAALVDELQSP